MHVLARLREIPGATPLRDGLEGGAMRLGPAIDGRLAGQLEGLAPHIAREGAEAGRRIGGPEGRQTDLRRFLAKRVGGDHQAVDVRHLALIGGHPVRRVTFDMLDRTHALAHGKPQILGGHVVLEIDEGLGLAGATVGGQFLLAAAGAGAVALDLEATFRDGEPHRLHRRHSGRIAVDKGGLVSPKPAARTGDLAGLGLVIGQEGLAVRIPGERPLGVREQVQGRRPAARHQQCVAGDLGGLADAAGRDRVHPHRGNAQPAFGAGGGMALQHADAARRGCIGQIGAQIIAGVNDGRDPAAGIGQIEGSVPGAVMAGQHGDVVTDADAIAVQIGLRRTRQHHAGAVVAVKDQRFFQRALCKDHPLRADPPHPFARGILRQLVQMIGQSFAQRDHVLMVIADGGRAGHHADAKRAQFRQPRCQPCPGSGLINPHRWIGQDRATHFGILVHQHDPRTRQGGAVGRSDPRRSGANHQHIRVQVTRGIGVGIFLAGGFAQTRGSTDERLIDLVPEAAWPHEGLVIETGREQHIGAIVHGPDVEGQARPFVLAFGDQPLAQFLHGGAGVGFKPARPARGADQGIRFLGPGGDGTTRTVVFERSSHQVNAIGQQGRGDGVPAQSLIGFAIEGKADRGIVIDAAASGDAIAVHSAASLRSGRGWPAL